MAVLIFIDIRLYVIYDCISHPVRIVDIDAEREIVYVINDLRLSAGKVVDVLLKHERGKCG